LGLIRLHRGTIAQCSWPSSRNSERRSPTYRRRASRSAGRGSVIRLEVTRLPSGAILGGLLITIIGGGLLFLLGFALNVRKVNDRWVSSDRHEFMDMSVEQSFIAPVVVGVIAELVAIGKEFGKVWGWTACFAIPIAAYVIYRWRHRAEYRTRKAAKPQRKALAANDRARAKARGEQLRAARRARQATDESTNTK
jgi:hypothetical protein